MMHQTAMLHAIKRHVEAGTLGDVLPVPDMVPRVIGPENVIARGASMTAIAGTGFDPDNAMHSDGRLCDELRYAIAIQQARDRKDYALADEICAFVTRIGCTVAKAKDRTTVTANRRNGVLIFPPPGITGDDLTPGFGRMTENDDERG